MFLGYLQRLAEVTEVLSISVKNQGQAELDRVWIYHEEVNS